MRVDKALRNALCRRSAPSVRKVRRNPFSPVSNLLASCDDEGDHRGVVRALRLVQLNVPDSKSTVDPVVNRLDPGVGVRGMLAAVTVVSKAWVRDATVERT